MLLPTGEEYVELMSEDELDKIRLPIEDEARRHQKEIDTKIEELYQRMVGRMPKNLLSLIEMTEEIDPKTASQLSVNKDPKTGRYFYPKIAFSEEVLVPRQVLIGKGVRITRRLLFFGASKCSAILASNLGVAKFGQAFEIRATLQKLTNLIIL